jgi:transcriptional regulator with XRE-family HTH domain
MAHPGQEFRRHKFLESVGQQLRRIREQRAASLRLLSKFSGVSHRAIWRIENAKTDARLSTLFVLAEALQVPVAELLSIQPSPYATGDKNLSWVMRYALPVEIAGQMKDEITQAIGGLVHAALTNEPFIGWLAEQIEQAMLRRIDEEVALLQESISEDKTLYALGNIRESIERRLLSLRAERSSRSDS